MKVHSDVFLEFLDLGDLHSWCGINLVKGHRRANYGFYIVDLDAIVFKGRADLVVVPGKFFVGDFVVA